MSLVIGPATDYIVNLAQTSTASITVDSMPVLVIDGPPLELRWGMFVVGLTDPPPDGLATISDTRDWAFDEPMVADDFTVPCYIDVHYGTTQKIARDLAETIFNGFWTSLAADVHLGGLLVGGGYADVTDLTETWQVSGSAAEPRHRTLITFGVHCRSVTQ